MEFLSQGVMTAPGRFAGLAAGVPGDPGGIAQVVQGLMIHEFFAGEYGVDGLDTGTVNVRPVEELLAAIVARDERPLAVAREPGARIATNCRGLTVLGVSLMREKGIPARARCGFGAYFTEGWFEDHWVVEFFDGARWRLIDIEMDARQAGKPLVDFDVTDVPHDRFLIGGEAWQLYRAGRVDPERFGLSFIPEGGAWWIAANLMRDAAALLGVEVLPWDIWDPMPGPDDKLDVAYFDELAAAEPDDLARLLPLPTEVFNVQRKQVEALTSRP